MLDIACGTGRILLPCLQAGVDIEGLDLFEPMLRTLRARRLPWACRLACTRPT